MSTMWCPTCRTEYREGILRCADCGTTLIDALPPLPTAPHQTRQLVTGPFSPDDDVVELMTTTAVEAEVTVAHLQSAGIPAAVFGVDAYSGYGGAFQNAQGTRIMVRRADVARAASFMRGQVGQPPRPKPVWVRGIATFILLLILIPVASAFPAALPLVILGGVAVVLTLGLRRRNRAESRR